MSDVEYESDNEVIEQDENNVESGSDASLDDVEVDDTEVETAAEVSVGIKPEDISQHIIKVYVIPPESRTTSNFMSTFEMTEYVSIRATMIAENNDCQVQVDDLSDPIMMARRELMQRKCPLKLEREVGKKYEQDENGNTVIVKYVEHWDVNEMGFNKTFDT